MRILQSPRRLFFTATFLLYILGAIPSYAGVQRVREWTDPRQAAPLGQAASLRLSFEKTGLAALTSDSGPVVRAISLWTHDGPEDKPDGKKPILGTPAVRGGDLARFTGRLPDGGRWTSAWTLTPGNATVCRYLLRPPRKRSERAIILAFELPSVLWAGTALRVEATEVPLPEAVSRKPLYSGEARTVSSEGRFLFAAECALECTVSDLRPERDGFLVEMLLWKREGEAGMAPARSGVIVLPKRKRRRRQVEFGCLFAGGEYSGAPVFLGVRGPAEITVGQIAEYRIRLLFGEGNPVFADTVNVTGRLVGGGRDVVAAPAFWSVSGERSLSGECGEHEIALINDGADESSRPAEMSGFRLRLKPPVTGTYSFITRADAGKNVVHARARTLDVLVGEPSAGSMLVKSVPGRVCASPADPRWLETAGKPLYPVGVDFAEPLPQTADYETAFRWMKAHGANLARIRFSDAAGAAPVAPKEAERIDRVLAAAARQGIHVLLTIAPAASLRTQYAASVEGETSPAGNAIKFFAEKEARKRFAERLRYIAARYGAFDSIFAWELCDSLDTSFDIPQTVSPGAMDRLFLRWAGFAAERMHSFDGHNRLVTAGALRETLALGMYAVEHIDVVEMPVSAPQVAPSWARESAPAGAAAKPSLASVISDPLASKALHEALWSSVMSGYAGVCTSVWSKGPPEEETGTQLLASARFVDGEVFAGKGYLAASSPPDAVVRSLGLVGKDSALLWVRLPKEDPEAEDPEDNPLKLLLSGLEPGRYGIEWWRASDGTELFSTTIDVSGLEVEIEVPRAARELAAKLHFSEPESPPR